MNIIKIYISKSNINNYLGLLQLLYLFRIPPPQDREHCENGPQLLQLPSTILSSSLFLKTHSPFIHILGL